MVKAVAVTDAIIVVGMVAISALMFAQVPGMIDDIKVTLSKQSVRAQAVEIADKISLVSASPNDIEIIHNLPLGVSYTITVKDGYVTVETASDKAADRTISTLTFGPDTVKSLSITKDEIKKVS